MSQKNFYEDNIKISNSVISRIAIITSLGVDGVHCMGENLANDIGAFFLQKETIKGAKVERIDDVVNLDLFVQLNYDFKIPQIVIEIQRRVKKAVEDTTNLSVGVINVHVNDIHKSNLPEVDPEFYCSRDKNECEE